MTGKHLAALSGAAVVAAAAFWLYRSKSVAAAVDATELLTVGRVDYPLIVSASGILEAARSRSIGPPRIANENRFKLARMVEEGKAVAEGDFLLEFDSSDISRRLRDETGNLQKVQEEYQKKRSDFDIQVRDLKLQLEEAKADLGKLDNKLSGLGELVGLYAASDVAETRIRRDAARRKVDLLEKKLGHVTEGGRLDLEISRSNENHYKVHMDRLLDAMDALTVTAPVAGVVIYRRDWNNEPRQVGSYIYVLDSVLEIPDLSSIRAKVMVDEVDAGRVRVGQDAKVTVDAVQGKVFEGKVIQLGAILKQAAYDRPQKVAEALIELRAPDKAIRPGMSARAQIQVGRYPGAIVIPMTSIRERDGRSFVQIRKASRGDWEWREVQLETNDGVVAVVSAGLEVNERVRAKPKE